MKKPDQETEVTVNEIQMTRMEFCVVGLSPLVPHAMSFKAKGQLIFPSKKKNQAEKDSSFKHDPYQEMRDAAYKFRGDEENTRLYLPGSMFHSAMSAAAIDISGAKKSQVGRLTSVEQEKIPLYGIPQIWSTIVRSSDMNRTPDIRTLPIIPKWAATFAVSFLGSLIPANSVANLLGAAGTIVGIGDGRPQKGKLAMGKFRTCMPDDKEFLSIVKAGTRPAQDRAMADPAFYDIETEELLLWFNAELDRRHAAPTKESKVLRPKTGNGQQAEV